MSIRITLKDNLSKAYIKAHNGKRFNTSYVNVLKAIEGKSFNVVEILETADFNDNLYMIRYGNSRVHHVPRSEIQFIIER